MSEAEAVRAVREDVDGIRDYHSGHPASPRASWVTVRDDVRGAAHDHRH